MNNILKNISKGLVVSCQALENEPLHSSYIMSRMAVAAKEGGAVGIRANTKDDIKEIKAVVDLPIIGIVKKDYEYSEVFITPTMNEVDELVEANCDIIAIDATMRDRPKGETLKNFYSKIKLKYPNQILMADCATFEDVVNSCELGFDIIGSTLVGYTRESSHLNISDNNFKLLKKMIDYTLSNKKFFIAEGNIDTPEKVNIALNFGASSVVVGSRITRPQLITKFFTSNMYSNIYTLDLDESSTYLENEAYIILADNLQEIDSFISNNSITIYLKIDKSTNNIYYANGMLVAKNISDYYTYLCKAKLVDENKLIKYEKAPPIIK